MGGGTGFSLDRLTYALWPLASLSSPTGCGHRPSTSAKGSRRGRALVCHRDQAHCLACMSEEPWETVRTTAPWRQKLSLSSPSCLLRHAFLTLVLFKVILIVSSSPFKELTFPSNHKPLPFLTSEPIRERTSPPWQHFLHPHNRTDPWGPGSLLPSSCSFTPEKGVGSTWCPGCFHSQ